jgi:lipopolysaccharide transport system permease protein
VLKDVATLPIRTYSAETRQAGFWLSQHRAIQEIWLTRDLLWRLFLRDFQAQYRQKLLGYCWTVLTPLLGVASFIFLYFVGIITPGDLEIPYPLFVFVGTGLWGIFVGGYQAVSGGLTAHGDLLVRTGIPKITLALAGLGNVMYGTLLHVVTLIVLVIAFGILPAWQAILYPLLLLPLFAAATGLGLLIGALGAVARDINNIFTTMLMFLMYLTPVVYVSNFSHPVLQAIVTWNPLSYLIDAPRTLFFVGEYHHWLGYSLASLLACLVLLVGVQAFYMVQDLVSERI